MIKKIVISLSVILSIVALYMLGSGFVRNGSAFLGEYYVSEDGTMMTVEVGVGSSIGAIRKVAIKFPCRVTRIQYVSIKGLVCMKAY